jgi:alginate O-acetyltransferase complex protein AlgI
MLFTSAGFLIVFVPILLMVFYLARQYQLFRYSLPILIIFSCIFYAAWDWQYLLLLFASIVLNFLCGKHLSIKPNKPLLIAGVTVNLLLLGYFKYSGFLVENLISVGFDIEFLAPILPLAISFYTFQQIAFLVDCHRQNITVNSPVQYTAFVLFFPQLVAGPIVHYRQLQPQLNALSKGEYSVNYVLASMYLLIGLAKKLLIADPLGAYVDPVYAAVSVGELLHTIEAWFAYLGYTLQLYFDFSAYGDMAIGLALMFGIQLPINFDSPYKSTSIIEFWRRWHMTLGAFLRDYLYIPLGGNKSGLIRKHANLIMTMLLGGLWHGAAWTFILWGMIHGTMLVMNHGLNGLFLKVGMQNSKFFRDMGLLLTFTCVSLSWVIFRADSISDARVILSGLLNFSDLNVSSLSEFTLTHNIDMVGAFFSIFVGLSIVFFCPNSHQITQYLTPRISTFVNVIQPLIRHPLFACSAGMIFFFIGKEWMLVPSAEFLYFNF